ncbi:TIR domain-containing protein [Tardiphaga sp. 839_C3_N1_4]|uniref:TIR domain-containing protein n=1 Tax=Tardiphaga sp. 839_C3_N1_4 TaxID=3240761 RepID=UPI003F1EE4BA
MADNYNPFNSLLGLGTVPTTPKPSPEVQALVDALRGASSTTPSPTFGMGLLGAISSPSPTFLGGLLDVSSSPTAFGSLAPPPRASQSASDIARILWPNQTPPTRPVARPAATPAIKRRAFFSFHFGGDSLRTNVVRNAWKIDHPSSETMRSFYDSSLWEARKLTNPDSIKNLIRAGVKYTSAVCVLVGSETWARRWVRYEIARAIADGRGLLAVHLNSIRHHRTLTAHTRGPNPLDFMAIGKVQPNLLSPARYHLFEKLAVPDGLGGYKWGWYRYSDYMAAVDLPDWMAEPADGYVVPLSDHADEYDYILDGGHSNIGKWIDRAAKRAGR